MEARCPSCSSIFAVHRSGLQYCPRCGSRVDVPEASAPPEPPPPLDPPQSPSASEPPPASASAQGLPPPPPPPAPPPARQPTPWERRGELGFFRSLWETWKQSLFSPDFFWRRVDPTARPQDALFYGWIIAFVTALLQAPLQAVQLGQEGPMQALLRELPNLPQWLERVLTGMFTPTGSVLVSLVSVGIAAVVYPLQLLIVAALLHLFCLLFGAAKHGFWATFRVVGYASGPLLFSVVPCVGLIGVVYFYVLQVFGLMRVQETSGGRATASVVALPLFMCCLACGLLSVAIMALTASLR